MKNWSVALLGSLVRAIATAPRSLRSRLRASLRIGARWGFSSISGVKPPPWIMKSGITRWKMVPS